MLTLIFLPPVPLPPSLPPSHTHLSAGTFPLDTTKTRLMVQGQLQAADELCKQTRYRGMTHALLRIPREEGLTALYKG